MPEDTPRQQLEVGHKPPRTDLTVLRWIAYGVLGLFPLGVVGWLAGLPADIIFTISTMLGAGFGMILGLLAAALAHLPADSRALMWACVRGWAAAGGAVMTFLLALLFYSAPPVHPERATGAYFIAALVGAGVGSLVGILHGSVIVRWRLARERRQFEIAQYEAVEREAALHERRRELLTAIAAKFGPLDPRRQEQVRRWDERRIADAARRLPDAGSVEELD